MPRFCQFKTGFFLLFAALFFTSCSFFKNKDELSDPVIDSTDDESKEVQASPPQKETWFSAPERFVFIDEEGQIPKHPFFDFDYQKGKENEFFFHPLTLEKSLYSYDFDLKSGRPYRTFRYCEQKDVWQKYKDVLFLPPYTEGILPRFLDEQGGAQRIYVFGSLEYDKENMLEPVGPVRVVGGFYEQFCRVYPCLLKETWSTRLILLGVDPQNPQFENVHDLKDLKAKVDWNYVKAFIQNAKGRTLSSGGDTPAYRVYAEIETKEHALESAKKRGHLFTESELGKLKKNCQYIYDNVYSSVLKIQEKIKKEGLFNDVKSFKGVISWEDETTSTDVFSKKMEALYKTPERNVWKSGDDLIKEVERIEAEEKKEKDKNLQRMLTEKKKVFNLGTFFHHLVEKYYVSYNACEKYVRPSNINENIERHNFFLHFSAVMKLFKMGYYYNCSQRVWTENLVGNDGKYVIDPVAQLKGCTSLDVDPAFTQAVLHLFAREKTSRDYYTYIDYDNGGGGSHKKIYDWVYQTGKKMSCLSQKEAQIQKAYTASPLPEDIKWTPFVIMKNE